MLKLFVASGGAHIVNAPDTVSAYHHPLPVTDLTLFGLAAVGVVCAIAWRRWKSRKS